MIAVFEILRLVSISISFLQIFQCDWESRVSSVILDVVTTAAGNYSDK